jgi:hypothetical protein
MSRAKRVVSECVIIDLVLTENGIEKTITRYLGTHGYCPKCYKFYAPAKLVNVNLRMGNYGHVKVARSGREKLPPGWS